MRARLICSVVLSTTFSSGTGTYAQSLDKSDTVSMFKSLDQNAKALQKSMDDAKKADPHGFKKWQQSRKFNLSYRPTASTWAAIGLPSQLKQLNPLRLRHLLIRIYSRTKTTSVPAEA